MNKDMSASVEVKKEEEKKVKIYKKKRLRRPRTISLGMEREMD